MRSTTRLPCLISTDQSEHSGTAVGFHFAGDLRALGKRCVIVTKRFAGTVLVCNPVDQVEAVLGHTATPLRKARTGR